MIIEYHGKFEVAGEPAKDGVRSGTTFAIMVCPEFRNGEVIALHACNYRFVVEARGGCEVLSLEQAKT
jgi:hypothetical protein